MLYLSTRDQAASFTAYRVIHENYAPDGGCFVPMRMPDTAFKQLCNPAELSFGDILAALLNCFFSSHLSGWEMECFTGKNPISLHSIGQKIYVAELWRNPNRQYDFLEETVVNRLPDPGGKITVWVRAVIKIAVLFTLCTEMNKSGEGKFNIAIDADDFSMPIAYVLARKVGLPIETAIFTFQKNKELWNLIHHGEMSTVSGVIPDLECFLYLTFGSEEAHKYLAAVQRKGVYKLGDGQCNKLKRWIFPAVVGENRVKLLLSQTENSNHYRMEDTTAISYGGLQDYRSQTGECRDTILFSYRQIKE